MATREANIKVTMSSGDFQSEVKKNEDKVKKSASRMKRSLKAGLKGGFDAAKKSMADMGTSLKANIKLAATFGGAFAIGSFTKDAIVLSSRLKDISYKMEIMTKSAVSWRDVQEQLNTAARETSRTTEEMAEAYNTVLSATKDPDFSFRTLEAIGMAATATGEEVSTFANIVQILQRKIGATAKEIPNLLGAMIELANQGGPTITELADKGDELGAIMKVIGLNGADGFKTIIGLMNTADGDMAGLDKQISGLNASLVKLAEQGALETLAKDAGIPKKVLKNVGGSFDAMKMVLGKGERGIKALQKQFTGPEGMAMGKLLMEPFIDAFRQARKTQEPMKASVEKGFAAMDKAYKDMAKTSVDEAALRKQSAKRAVDADSRSRAALDRMKQSFAKPEMISAIEKLAKSLPAFAEKLALLISWIVENPMKAAVAGAGLKIGGAAAMGGVSGFAKSAAGGASDLEAALKLGGMAKQQAGKFALGKGMTGKQVGGAIGAVMVAAGIGWSIGSAISAMLEPQTDKFFKSSEETENAIRAAKETARTGTVGEKFEAFDKLEAEFGKAAANKPGAYTALSGGFISLFTDAKSPTEIYIENLQKISDGMTALNESIDKTTDQVDKTGDSMKGLKDNANDAAGALGNGSGGSDSSRGTSHVGTNPGAEPARG